jgi:hypothetical protein
VFLNAQEKFLMANMSMGEHRPIQRGVRLIQEKQSMNNEEKKGDDMSCHTNIHMSCHVIIDVSFHVNQVDTSG